MGNKWAELANSTRHFVAAIKVAFNVTIGSSPGTSGNKRKRPSQARLMLPSRAVISTFLKQGPLYAPGRSENKERTI
jgi:hypothetical protein